MGWVAASGPPNTSKLRLPGPQDPDAQDLGSTLSHFHRLRLNGPPGPGPHQSETSEGARPKAAGEMKLGKKRSGALRSGLRDSNAR